MKFEENWSIGLEEKSFKDVDGRRTEGQTTERWRRDRRRTYDGRHLITIANGPSALVSLKNSILSMSSIDGGLQLPGKSFRGNFVQRCGRTTDGRVDNGRTDDGRKTVDGWQIITIAHPEPPAQMSYKGILLISSIDGGLQLHGNSLWLKWML